MRTRFLSSSWARSWVNWPIACCCRKQIPRSAKITVSCLENEKIDGCWHVGDHWPPILYGWTHALQRPGRGHRSHDAHHQSQRPEWLRKWNQTHRRRQSRSFSPKRPLAHNISQKRQPTRPGERGLTWTSATHSKLSFSAPRFPRTTDLSSFRSHPTVRGRCGNYCKQHRDDCPLMGHRVSQRHWHFCPDQNGRSCSWPAQLIWVDRIQPALKTTQVTETDLLPAVFVNLLGVAVGFAGSLIVTSRRSGRLRSFNLWHLRFDLTPRVWNWFFQEPVQGRLYRIRLSSGDQLIGQITAYSISPDDDVQEIIVELYSRGGKDGPTQAVTDARRLLVSRSEIETIEQLRVALQVGPGDSCSFQSMTSLPSPVQRLTGISIPS
jgi:Family of unknown function (DUF6338)